MKNGEKMDEVFFLVFEIMRFFEICEEFKSSMEVYVCRDSVLEG